MHNLTVRVDGSGNGGSVARHAEGWHGPLEAHCPKVDHLENGLSEARITWLYPVGPVTRFLMGLPVAEA